MVITQDEYQVQAEIPLAFMRYLEKRTDERVLEVVLVYNGVDRFDTVIDPEGMRSDPNIVTVDYNHKQVNTGAYLRNVRIEDNYILEDGTTLERVLVGNVHIPKDSEMFYMTREGEKKSNGNLYEAVTKGQVRSVSVEFKPYKGKQITNTKTGITIFREWDLIRLSLLDVTPGQPYSGYKLIRSLINNNMSITIENIKLALDNGELQAEDLRTLTIENRDITIEKNIAEEEPTTPTDEPTTPVDEADTNGDGEISDEEIRSFIKEIKRSYKEPKEMTDKINKIDELERMCGDISAKMDDISKATSQRELDEEEIEAQTIRALNQNLANIPDKVETRSSEKQPQLGEGENYKGEKQDNSTEKLRQEILKTIQYNN
jgi:hypothetical protein